MPEPVGWAPDQVLLAQFMNPDGTVNQQALFEAEMARLAGYNPEGDPSLGADVNFGWSGLTDQYGNTGTRHFTPEELAQNGGAPMTFFTGPGQVWTTTDQQEIADRRDDQQTRTNQAIAQIAAMIVGGTALTGGFGGGGAGAGASDGLTGVVAGNGNPAAVMLPGAGAGTAGAGVTAASNAAWGSAIPALSQLPSAIATPAAVNTLTGATGAAPALTSGSGAATATGTNAATGAANTAGGAANAVGNALDWASIVPAIVSGVTGVLGSNAQADASRDALALAERLDNRAREDALPRIQAGNRAVGVLDRLMGLSTGTPDMSAFTSSPDYAYNLAETTKAGDRALSSMGLGNSGARVRESQRNASGLASRDYGSFVNRLLATAGLGTTGAAASAASGANTADLGGNAIQNRGAARSSGYGAVNDAVQGGYANILLNQYLRRNPVGP